MTKHTLSFQVSIWLEVPVAFCIIVFALVSTFRKLGLLIVS